MTFHRPSAPFRAAKIATAALTALILLMTASANTAAADPPHIVQTADVLGQGGDGVYQEDGARLVRSETSLRIKWKVPTPAPGTYQYPTADQVPPGAPTHPEIIPGWPEVFTLWVFVFNHPELCSAPCDFDDIGDTTAAQGGVYQLDATVALDGKIRFKGKVKVGEAPLVGAALQNPNGAEVHPAMAPHGKAHCGEALEQQLTGSVGNPSFWWPALFFPDDAS